MRKEGGGGGLFLRVPPPPSLLGVTEDFFLARAPFKREWARLRSAHAHSAFPPSLENPYFLFFLRDPVSIAEISGPHVSRAVSRVAKRVSLRKFKAFPPSFTPTNEIPPSPFHPPSRALLPSRGGGGGGGGGARRRIYIPPFLLAAIYLGVKLPQVERRKKGGGSIADLALFSVPDLLPSSSRVLLRLHTRRWRRRRRWWPAFSFPRRRREDTCFSSFT